MASLNAQSISHRGSFEVGHIGASSSQIEANVHEPSRRTSQRLSPLACFDPIVQALRAVQRPSSAPPISRDIEAWTGGEALPAMPTLDSTKRAIEETMQEHERVVPDASAPPKQDGPNPTQEQRERTKRYESDTREIMREVFLQFELSLSDFDHVEWLVENCILDARGALELAHRLGARQRTGTTPSAPPASFDPAPGPPPGFPDTSTSLQYQSPLPRRQPAFLLSPVEPPGPLGNAHSRGRRERA